MIENVTLVKVSTQESIDLSMLSTPYFILDSVDWGTIQSTHHSYKYVNQIGVSITGTSLETRSVEISAWIIANTEDEMTERKSILNKFINPQEAIDLFYSDYSIRFIPDRTVQYSVGYKENNDTIVKFKIVGTCPDPLFSDSFQSKETIAATIGVFHFPLIISENLYEKGVIFGYRQQSLTANVRNSGAVQTGMKIVFKANGTVKNPKLINVNTHEQFLITKTLVAEEEVTINTNIGEKSVVGHVSNNPDTNYFMYKDIDSKWLQLDVGENLFRYDAESGLDNLEVYMYFSNKYLEVQECY